MSARTIWRSLAVLLLTFTLVAAFARRTPPTQPLPPAHTVVLLLTPGLAYDELLSPTPVLSPPAPLSQAKEGSSILGASSATAYGNSTVTGGTRLDSPLSLAREGQGVREQNGEGARGWVTGVLTTRSAADAAPSADPLGIAAQVLATGNRTPATGASALGLTLRRAGVHTVPLTNSDPAAAAVLGLPRPDPILSDQPLYKTPQANLPDGYVTSPIPFAQAIGAAVDAANAPGTPPTLIVATFDDLYRDDQYAPFALPSATRAERIGSLRRLYGAIRALTRPEGESRLMGDVAILVVTPFPSNDARLRGERLGPVALWRPDGGTVERQLLTSASTRMTPGLIAGTDVAATVASLLNLPPSACAIGAGRPARMIPEGDGGLRRRIAGWDAQARALTLLIYVPWAFAALLIAATLLANRGLPRPALALATAATLYPAALIACAGWADLGRDPIYLYICAALPSAAAAFAVLFAPNVLPHRRRILGGIGLATALLILGDVLTGGFLLAHSPLSYSVMEAARFFGIGNEAAGVLIGASLLAAGLLFDGDGPAIALFGAAVCLTLVLPTLGAKAGSLIGAVVGFALALAPRTGSGVPRRLTPRIAVALGLAVLALAAFSIWDSTRDPDSQTHLGQAIGGAHQGGLGTLVAIVRRKAAMDLHLLTTSPWAALLATEIALLVVWYRRVRHNPARSEAVLTALLPVVGAGIGLLPFNDAGVVGAALCLLYAVPLTLLSLQKENRENHESSEEIVQP